MIGRLVVGALCGLVAWTLISCILGLAWGIARAGQKRRDHDAALIAWREFCATVPGLADTDDWPEWELQLAEIDQ